MGDGENRKNSGTRRSISQPARRRGRRPPDLRVGANLQKCTKDLENEEAKIGLQAKPRVEFAQECFLCARAASCPPTEHVTEYMQAYKMTAIDPKRTHKLRELENPLIRIPLEAEGQIHGRSKMEESLLVPSLFDYWDEVREWATEHKINFIYVPGKRSEMKRRDTNIKLEGAFTFLTDYGENYVLFNDAFRPPLIKPTSLLHLQGEHSFLPEYKEKYIDFAPEKRSIFRKSTYLKLAGENMFVSDMDNSYTRLSELPPIENTFKHHRIVPTDTEPVVSEYTAEYDAKPKPNKSHKDTKNSSFLPEIESKFMVNNSTYTTKLPRGRTDLNPVTTSASKRAKSGNITRHDKVLPVLKRSDTVTRSLDRPRKSRSRRPESVKKLTFRMNVDKTDIADAAVADDESATRIKWKMNAEKSTDFVRLPLPHRPVVKSFLVLEHSQGNRRNKWMRD